MNEEEKEAIENIKIKAEYIGENYSFGKQGIRNLKKDLKTVLNYINKLQKENEFLKAPFEYANGNTLDKRYVELNFISKDKIKNEIKELEEIPLKDDIFR